VQNDEQENHLLIEDPVLASHCIDDSNHLLSTGETKEVFSSEMVIKQNNENETTPVINEYDLPINGQESRYQKTFSFLFSFIYI
jgi:hypothetical protein